MQKWIVLLAGTLARSPAEFPTPFWRPASGGSPLHHRHTAGDLARQGPYSEFLKTSDAPVKAVAGLFQSAGRSSAQIGPRRFPAAPSHPVSRTRAKSAERSHGRRPGRLRPPSRARPADRWCATSGARPFDLVTAANIGRIRDQQDRTAPTTSITATMSQTKSVRGRARPRRFGNWIAATAQRG